MKNQAMMLIWKSFISSRSTICTAESSLKSHFKNAKIGFEVSNAFERGWRLCLFRTSMLQQTRIVFSWYNWAK
jgi:hypothetical protein